MSTAQDVPVYSLRDVRHHYNGRAVLAVDALEVPRGIILGLCGSNGAGKSTLLRFLAFLERPRQGGIVFAGTPALDLASLRRRATLLLQRPVLLRRSVFENVAFGLRARKETADLSRKVSEALEAVGLPFAAFARRSWRELSGGEAQRVAMAARLVLRPEVLLLDEPTSSLDPESEERITAAARLARDRHGATVVVVSHDLAWLRGLCDTVLRLAAPLPSGQAAPLTEPPLSEDCA